MISIIIPAYNEEKYIKKTLKSIKGQDFKVYETIVICNGCTDKTEKIAKKYADKVFSIEKPSIVKAQNLGARKAKYSLLLFLDADVILKEKNTLKHISKYNLGTCKIKPIENKLKFRFYAFVKNLSSTLIGSKNGVLFCRKDLFRKIGGFKEGDHPKENYPLIKQARKYAIFKTVNPYIDLSMRRYDKQGFVKTSLYWLRYNIFPKKEKYKSFR